MGKNTKDKRKAHVYDATGRFVVAKGDDRQCTPPQGAISEYGQREHMYLYALYLLVTCHAAALGLDLSRVSGTINVYSDTSFSLFVVSMGTNVSLLVLEVALSLARTRQRCGNTSTWHGCLVSMSGKRRPVLVYAMSSCLIINVYTAGMLYLKQVGNLLRFIRLLCLSGAIQLIDRIGWSGHLYLVSDKTKPSDEDKSASQKTASQKKKKHRERASNQPNPKKRTGGTDDNMSAHSGYTDSTEYPTIAIDSSVGPANNVCESTPPFQIPSIIETLSDSVTPIETVENVLPSISLPTVIKTDTAEPKTARKKHKQPRTKDSKREQDNTPQEKPAASPITIIIKSAPVSVSVKIKEAQKPASKPEAQQEDRSTEEADKNQAPKPKQKQNKQKKEVAHDSPAGNISINAREAEPPSPAPSPSPTIKIEPQPKPVSQNGEPKKMDRDDKQNITNKSPDQNRSPQPDSKKWTRQPRSLKASPANKQHYRKTNLTISNTENGELSRSGRVITSDINQTISIDSVNIPHSVTAPAKKAIDSAQKLPNSSSGDNTKPDAGATDKVNSTPKGRIVDCGDMDDTVELEQYGKVNVKCLGAAAVYSTGEGNQANIIKNITSPLFAFTSLPTKDIVIIPTSPTRTFKNVTLTVSATPQITLTEHDMLILAAKNNNLAEIEQYKEYTGHYDSSGMFALAYCTLANNLEGVKLLLDESKMCTKSSMRFSSTDYVGVDALMLAVLSGSDREIIELLIPISDICKEGYTQMTPLMAAAMLCNTAAIQLLMNHQKNEKTTDGRTALMIAADMGFDDCVKIFVENSVELGHQNKMGWSALCYAADNGHTACVELLAPKEAMTLILFAYDRRASSGIIVNFMSATALMLAAWKGSAECVTLLKDREAKVQTHKYENTALIIAATAGHTECVQLLIDVEARMCDSSGRTALMKAATENNIECVRILAPKEHGMVDESGMSALVFAARKNHVKCVKALAPYEAEKFHGSILNRNWCSPEVAQIIKKFMRGKKGSGSQNDRA